VDICDTAQLWIFIVPIDEHFDVTEELIGLKPLHGTTKSTDVFENLKLCTENYTLEWKKIDTQTVPLLWLARIARGIFKLFPS
jgi:hypothetical protein